MRPREDEASSGLKASQGQDSVTITTDMNHLVDGSLIGNGSAILAISDTLNGLRNDLMGLDLAVRTFWHQSDS